MLPSTVSSVILDILRPTSNALNSQHFLELHSSELSPLLAV
jgi:hypothetical protein